MGNQNSGNRRTDYRRGRYPQDSAITEYNKGKTQLIIRVRPELRDAFMELARSSGSNATEMIVAFMKRMVSRAEKGYPHTGGDILF